MIQPSPDPLPGSPPALVPSGISVVIPARNEASVLPGCLEALFHQTVPPTEIIVVDNGSTDATVAVARAAGVRIVDEPRPGAAHARQAGFRAARCQVVASTDADGRVPPDWIERYAELLARSPNVVAAFGPFRFLRGTAPNPTTNRLLPLLSFLQRVSVSATSALGHPFFAGSNFAVRKAAFEAVDGFFDPATGAAYPTWEDVELGRKLMRIGHVQCLRGLVVDVSARYMGSLRAKFLEAAGKALKLHREGRG